MRIALDVDGVLANAIPLWIELCNTQHGTALSLGQATQWEFWRPFGISRPEFFRIFSAVWQNWRRLEPTEPTIGAKVDRLRQFGPLDIVTGRTRDTFDYVHRWLSAHGIQYDRFVPVPSMLRKAALPYEVFIDDAPEVAMGVAARRRQVLLYDQPWNREVPDSTHIARVRGLDEAHLRLATWDATSP